MPRKVISKKAKAVPLASTVKKTRKARVNNVRELVIKALKSGSKSRPALQKATGASYNGLVMHLSKLKDEGLVAFDASNRIVSLVGSPVTASKATTKSAKKPETAAVEKAPSTALAVVETPAALVPVSYAATVLKDALDQFMERIKPIEALDDKVLVLDHLAGQLGGAIAVVLSDIKSDLLRSATV
jgi:hypothetical protein